VRSAAPRRSRSASKRLRALAQASLACGGVAVFFIDTSTGQVATQRQLVEAGITPADELPPRPWHRIQGTGDATTMWYAVMRKQVRDGVYIGALCIRHQDHHASLLQEGWQEVPPSKIHAPSEPGPTAGG
jgi:hypothetical protein